MLRKEHKVSNISSEAIFAIPSMKPIKVLVSLGFCTLLLLSDIYYKSSDYLRSYGKDLITPFVYLSEVPSRSIKTAQKILSSRKDMDSEIKSLKEKNLKLQIINQQIAELIIENKKLESLWDIANLDLSRYQVVKKRFLSSNEFVPTLTADINQSEVTVKIDDAVFGSAGLIGKVLLISTLKAEIMLIQDPKSLVPIISSSSRIHSMAQGSGIGRLGKLNNVKKTSKYSLGEILHTSGLGDIFPAGFPVARIVKIIDSPDNNYLDIRIEFISNPLNEDFFLIYTGSKNR